MVASSTPVLPFDQVDVPEIPLRSTPLVLALAQARFAEQFALSNSTVAEATIANFGSSVRTEFPGFQTQNVVNIQLSPMGAQSVPTGAVQWIFSSADGQWQLTLTRDFMSLTSVEYQSRSDFLARWRRASEALTRALDMPRIQRVGVRYVNRFGLENGTDGIRDYFRDELRSLSADFEGANVVQSITDLVFKIESRTLHARAGVVPAGVVFDPTIEPLLTASWVFDIDAYDESPFEASADALVASAESLAVSAYKFFRWGVTEKFIADFAD